MKRKRKLFCRGSNATGLKNIVVGTSTTAQAGGGLHGRASLLDNQRKIGEREMSNVITLLPAIEQVRREQLSAKIKIIPGLSARERVHLLELLHDIHFSDHVYPCGMSPQSGLAARQTWNVLDRLNPHKLTIGDRFQLGVDFIDLLDKKLS